MEEEIKKMLYEKIKHSEQGLTDGEAKLAIYLLEQEKEEKGKTISITTQTGEGIQTVIEKAMREKKEEETAIGKKITVKGSGGFGTEILLDDKYSIDRLYNFKAEMDAENGSKVMLEFSPHEIEIKTNKEEAIF